MSPSLCTVLPHYLSNILCCLCCRRYAGHSLGSAWGAIQYTRVRPIFRHHRGRRDSATTAAAAEAKERLCISSLFPLAVVVMNLWYCCSWWFPFKGNFWELCRSFYRNGEKRVRVVCFLLYVFTLSMISRINLGIKFLVIISCLFIMFLIGLRCN